MSSDDGQQDCVCDTESNELDKVEYQGRDDDYAPGVILHKCFLQVWTPIATRTRSHLNTRQSDV